ncbi:MAG: DMT family transporter [Spirochaetales bacterium]|nr:DMT family transporter [Spirochaetales bacterium]
MVIVYALLSAVSYGAADFLGGFSSRKNSATAVVAWSQGMGLLTVLAAAPLIGAGTVPVSDLLWGMAAGTAGAMGVGILYYGLAHGLASVISPVAAVTGAAVPVFFGVLSGERPDTVTWAGIFLAFAAIILLSREKSEKKEHVLRSLQIGLLSGLAFSGFFIIIARTSEESGMWPLLAARCTTVPVFFLITLLKRDRVKLVKGTGKLTLASGFLDMAANVFYLLAARTGNLILAVILTALYPAPTVYFQKIFLKERLTASRTIGLVLAIAGAALIGIGG